ncbi:MAG: hypothetical protein ACRDQ7_12735, partial [Haloechinothrix sp.]
FRLPFTDAKKFRYAVFASANACCNTTADTSASHARSGVRFAADLRTESGPFAMMTARGFLADEGRHAAAVLARGMSRPAYLRKMMWLMPRMARAVPYLGYVLLMAIKPERTAGEGTA